MAQGLVVEMVVVVVVQVGAVVSRLRQLLLLLMRRRRLPTVSRLREVGRNLSADTEGLSSEGQHTTMQ